MATAIYGLHPLGWHPPIYLAMDNTHIYVGQPIERVQRAHMTRRPYRDAHEVKIGRTPVPVPLRVLARGRVQLTGFLRDCGDEIIKKQEGEQYCACVESKDF